MENTKKYAYCFWELVEKIDNNQPALLYCNATWTPALFVAPGGP